MTFEARKLELIRHLVAMKEEEKLEQIEDVVYGNAYDENWRLTPEQEASLRVSIAQADAGQTIPHEEVMREVKAKIARFIEY